MPGTWWAYEQKAGAVDKSAQDGTGGASVVGAVDYLSGSSPEESAVMDRVKILSLRPHFIVQSSCPAVVS